MQITMKSTILTSFGPYIRKETPLEFKLKTFPTFDSDHIYSIFLLFLALHADCTVQNSQRHEIFIERSKSWNSVMVVLE